MFILSGQENARGLGQQATGEITKSHQFNLAMPSSSVVYFKAKDKMLKLLESDHVEGKKTKLPEPDEVT